MSKYNRLYLLDSSLQQNFTKGELSNLIKKFRKQLGLD